MDRTPGKSLRELTLRADEGIDPQRKEPAAHVPTLRVIAGRREECRDAAAIREQFGDSTVASVLQLADQVGARRGEVVEDQKPTLTRVKLLAEILRRALSQ